MFAFDQFARLLVDAMAVDVDGRLEPSTHLANDLEIDSLQTLQLLIVIESAAGLDVPSAELPELETLGDAYEYYRVAVGQAAA